MILAVKSNLFYMLFQVGPKNFHSTGSEVSDWLIILPEYNLNSCDGASQLSRAI